MWSTAIKTWKTQIGEEYVHVGLSCDDTPAGEEALYKQFRQTKYVCVSLCVYNNMCVHQFHNAR